MGGGLLSRVLGGRQKPMASQKHPSAAMAMHNGDVVLRFKVRTEKEGKALADAANELYLDVWSANKDHVDLRIAKDSVRTRNYVAGAIC